MTEGLINKWQWQMIKIIVKQSIKYNNEGYIINQEIVKLMKDNPKIIKSILKKGNRAQNHLKMAVNQFNQVVEEQDVDESIYRIIECEKEITGAMEFVDIEFKKLLFN
jgi:hypothetical protein